MILVLLVWAEASSSARSATSQVGAVPILRSPQASLTQYARIRFAPAASFRFPITVMGRRWSALVLSPVQPMGAALVSDGS